MTDCANPKLEQAKLGAGHFMGANTRQSVRLDFGAAGRGLVAAFGEVLKNR